MYLVTCNHDSTPQLPKGKITLRLNSTFIVSYFCNSISEIMLTFSGIIDRFQTECKWHTSFDTIDGVQHFKKGQATSYFFIILNNMNTMAKW